MDKDTNWLTNKPLLVQTVESSNPKIKIERRASLMLAECYDIIKTFETDLIDSKNSCNQEHLIKLQNKVEVGKIIMKVIKKLKKELSYAKAELVKTSIPNEMTRCRKRIVWLHERMLKSLQILKSNNLCEVKLKNSPNENIQKSLETTTMSLKPLTEKESTTIFDIGGISIFTEKETMLKEDFDKINSENNFNNSDTYDDETECSITMEKDTSSLYWESENNRLEFGEYCILEKNPTSYHAMAMGVSGSFVDKRCTLPKPPPWNNANHSNVHRIEIDQLNSKFFLLCNSIYDAAQASIPLITEENEKKNIYSSTKLDENIPVISKQHKLEDFSITYPISDKLSHRTKLNKDTVFPIHPSSFSKSHPRHIEPPKGVVDQHNLKEETKFTLYKRPTLPLSLQFQDMHANSNTLLKRHTLRSSEWSSMKPRSGVMQHSGLKLERVKYIVGKSLKSVNDDERVDAAKSAGLLNCLDTTVIGALKDQLENDKNERVKFEAALSLVKFGIWYEKLIDEITNYLAIGNLATRIHVLECLQKSPKLNFSKKEKLIQVLLHLTKRRNEIIAITSAIVLGRMEVEESKEMLLRILDMKNINYKYLYDTILHVLIKTLNVKSKIVYETVLFQLENSPAWKHRQNACEFLTILGLENIDEEKTYFVLERKLWDEPIKIVRQECTETLASLKMLGKAAVENEKNLESRNSEIRARAVKAVGTLKMNTKKIIRMLLEMLELDSSIQVRIEVIRTFKDWGTTDNQVIRALYDKKTKSIGLLAKEADLALLKIHAI